jgi:probable F420-dependent oxidoreductase
MTPEFTPTNIEQGRPKVVLAAVGPLMQKCAAQTADGVIMHAFCTGKHLREVLLPKIREGLAEAGRNEDEFEIHCPVFKVTGINEEDFEKSKEAIKYRIGFYASTPAYRGVLETHGWGDLQPVLHKLTRENKWDQLTSHISDDVLDAFAVVGEPLEVAKKLKQRYGDLVDRTTLSRDLPADIITQQLKILRS